MATAALITRDDQQLIDTQRVEFDKIITALESHNITDDQTMQQATDMVAVVKQGMKALENRRKDIVGPLNDDVKIINGKFNSLRDLGQGAVKKLERQMTAHLQEKQRVARVKQRADEQAERDRLAKEQKELAELEAMGDDSRETTSAIATNKIMIQDHDLHESTPEPTIVRGQVGKSSLVKGAVEVRIVDLSLVPIEYLELNETRARTAFKQNGQQIPGLEIEQLMTTRTS